MSEHTRKTLTFITRQAPYGQSGAKACLDMVLSAAVFDQQVHYIFMGAGVLQLRRGQQPGAIHAKDLSAAFSALPLYDVDSIHVEAEALRARGMSAQDLVIPVKEASAADIATLINHSDAVFNL